MPERSIESQLVTESLILAVSRCPMLGYLLIREGTARHWESSFSRFRDLLEKEAWEYEQEVLKQESRKGESLYLDEKEDLRERMIQTQEAMRQGKNMILNGALSGDEKRVCEKVHLTKEMGGSVLGDYLYLPFCVSHQKKSDLEEIKLKLAYAAYCLEFFQGIKPREGILIDRGGRESKIELASSKKILRRCMKQGERLLSGIKKFPRPQEHCPVCVKKNQCYQYFIEKEWLYIVPEISLKQYHCLCSRGLETIDHLTRAPEGAEVFEKYDLPGVNLPLWRVWKTWAQAYKNRHVILCQKPLIPSSRTEVIISVFGDIISEKKLLIGILIVENEPVSRISKITRPFQKIFRHPCEERISWIDNQHKLVQLFVRPRDGEQRLLDRLIQILMGSMPCQVYFYGDYAEQSILELLERNEIKHDQAIRLKRSIHNEYSNLRQIVMRCLGIPTFSYSLRDVWYHLAWKSRHFGALSLREDTLFHSQKWDVLYECRKWIKTKKEKHRERLFLLNQNEMEAVLDILTCLKNYS